MTWVERFITWCMPHKNKISSDAMGLAVETCAMAKRVDGLGVQARQLADWWTNDAKTNHYAERIREAYRAELTGQQPKTENNDEVEKC